jgi:DnaJ-class molecular chaperone
MASQVASAWFQENLGGRPSSNIRIGIPMGVQNGSEFIVEAFGVKCSVHILIEPPEGWAREGTVLVRTQKLTLLDQILGAKFELSMPTGEKKMVSCPPNFVQGAFIVLNRESNGEPLAVRLDFSRELCLNDNERNQINKLRSKCLKREAQNGK